MFLFLNTNYANKECCVPPLGSLDSFVIGGLTAACVDLWLSCLFRFSRTSLCVPAPQCFTTAALYWGLEPEVEDFWLCS